MKRTKNDRTAWMAAFEEKVLAVMPELSGRIDWDTATFFFNQGLSPTEAASRVIARKAEVKS